MATELAQGYLSLSVRFQSGAFRQIESSLAATQRASERTGRTIGRHLSAGSKAGTTDVKVNLSAAQSAFDRASRVSQRAGEATQAAQRKATIATRETAEATRRYGADSLQALRAQDREARATKTLSEAKLKEASASKAASDAERKLDAAKKSSIGRTPRMLQPLKRSLANFKKTLPNPFEAMPRMAQTSAGRAVQALNSRISSGMGRVNATVSKATGVASKAAIAGAGAATAGAVAGVGFALKKGFGRLESIDNAKQKLLGLGNSAKDVDQIMQDATASVKGTSFGLEEAATTSAMMVATGIKPGKELASTLRTVADTATIAGMSMGDAGKIFSSVAARGKLQGDDMMQLTSAGVPVLQALSKHLKKSQADVSNMVSKGQIDFKTFAAAMDDSLGGSAAKSGDTFAGSLKNMGASIGRMGAGLMQGAFPRLAPMFQDLTKSMAPLEEASKRVGERIGNLMAPAFDAIGRTLHGGGAVAGIGRLKDALGGLWDIIARNDFSGRFAKAFNVQEDSALVGWLLQVRNGFAAIFDLLVHGRLDERVATILGVDPSDTLVVVLTAVHDRLGAIPEVAGRVKQAFKDMWSGLAVTDAFDDNETVGKLTVWQQRGAQLREGISRLWGMLEDFASAAVTLVQGVWAVAGPAITAVLSGIGKLIGKMVVLAGAAVAGVVVGTLKVLTPLMQKLGGLMQRHAVLLQAIAVSVGAAVGAIIAGRKAVLVVDMMGKAAVGAVKSFRALKEVFQGFKTTATAVRAFAAANPLGLIVIAVAAVTAGLIYAYTHSERFRNAVNALGTHLKNFGAMVGRQTAAMREHLHNFGTVVKHGADVVFGGIRGAFQGLWNWVSKVFLVWWNGLKLYLTTPLVIAKALITGNFGAIRAQFTKIWQWVKSVFALWWQTVKPILGRPVEAARDMIGKAWGKIKGFFSSVGNWIRGAWNSSWSTVKGIMVRPIHAARDAIHTALDKIRSFFDGTKNAIKKSWDGLRGIMSAPVRWVADRVINPMVRSYNTLAGKVGMGKKLTEWSFKGFRTGGYTGNAGVDQAAGIVHGREYVLTAEETHRLGGPGGVEAWKRVALGRGYRRGGYVWPTTSRRLSPNYRRHSGVDIPVPTGTPLFATEDGTVSYVGTGRGYGRAIFLNGADGVPWVYGHTLRATVATGTRVRRGQQIGLSDNTGHSTGPHLHIEAARGRFAQPSNRAYTLGLLGGSMSPAGGLGLPATGDGEGYFDPLGWLKGKIAGPLGRLKELGSGFGQVVKGMATSIGDGMLGAAGRWAKDMASRAWDSVAAGAGKGLALVRGAGQIARWAPFVERALRVSGIGGGPLDVALWLKQIKTESDGNPRLVQSSALRDINVRRGDPARGLVQVPGVTWVDFGRDMGPFIPNVYDPFKNLVVGMRAAGRQHRHWRRVIGHGHGYLRGGRVMTDEWSPVSEDGRPELVVGPQMAQLAAGTKVFNANQTRQMMGWGGTPKTLVVRDVNDELIGRMQVVAADTATDVYGDMARIGAFA